MIRKAKNLTWLSALDLSFGSCDLNGLTNIGDETLKLDALSKLPRDCTFCIDVGAKDNRIVYKEENRTSGQESSVGKSCAHLLPQYIKITTKLQKRIVENHLKSS